MSGSAMPSRRAFVAAFAALGVAPAHAATQLRVLAAVSLADALNETGDAYAATGKPRPVFVFAASSTLARQIEQGAPGDLFISADEAWMDHLQARNLIERASRTPFLTNRLVLIAPADRPFRLSIRRGFDLRGALRGRRLAMADPDSVPAGRYGRAALAHLGVWASLAPSVVRAENVRAALRYVEMGEAAAGIVYATDAQAAGARVVVVDQFPADSHPPITYPLAIVAGRSSEAVRGFARFLQSAQGDAIFRRHGFGVD